MFGNRIFDEHVEVIKAQGLTQIAIRNHRDIGTAADILALNCSAKKLLRTPDIRDVMSAHVLTVHGDAELLPDYADFVVLRYKFSEMGLNEHFASREVVKNSGAIGIKL
jgi:hypothetical protein